MLGVLTLQSFSKSVHSEMTQTGLNLGPTKLCKVHLTRDLDPVGFKLVENEMNQNVVRMLLKNESVTQIALN